MIRLVLNKSGQILLRGRVAVNATVSPGRIHIAVVAGVNARMTPASGTPHSGGTTLMTPAGVCLIVLFRSSIP